MEQAVQGGGGHDGITGKDFGPVTKGFVGSEDDGAVIVITLRDHLKEETGLCLVQLQVAHFVNNQELGTGHIVQFAMEFVLSQGLGQTPRHLNGGGEIDAMPGFGSEQPEGDGQMRFPDPGQNSHTMPIIFRLSRFTTDGIHFMAAR